MKTILIATHNPGKLTRYQRLLGQIPTIKLTSLSERTITEEVDEPFETSLENAIHKAKFYAELSQLPTLAIDEAVTTNFLPPDEQPGVYVRRLKAGGTAVSDEAVLEHWQSVFARYPQEDKLFVWDFSIAYVDQDKLQTIKAVQNRKVAQTFSKVIDKGYPMSSFMIPVGGNKPFSEYTDDEKLAVDQKTFREFLEVFPSWL